MKEKSTGDLMRDLRVSADLSEYVRNNEVSFFEDPLQELLTRLFERKCISKAELARRSGGSEVFLHQVFSGRRKPSRDRLLCICIGMGASLEETQELLRRAAYAPLYPRLKRDAVIAYGILHHMTLEELNDSLFTEKESTLY